MLGIVGALVLVGITPLLVERILNIPPDLVGEAKATFYLLALSVPVVLVSSSFRGVLEASQLLENPKIAGKIGYEGMKMIRVNYSWQKIMQDFSKTLYAHCTKNRKNIR